MVWEIVWKNTAGGGKRGRKEGGKEGKNGERGGKKSEEREGGWEVVNRMQKDCEEPIHSWFNIQKSIHVIHHINKQTTKKEKPFDQNHLNRGRKKSFNKP